MPVCSIVIRAYNEEKHIGRLLSGITHQTVADVQIILVDSGSTDSTVAIARTYPVEVVSIRPQEFTFGRSLNLGVAARAILIARGAAELARLGVALGGQEKTFYGLAGVGEMVVATDGRGSADFELGRLLIEGVPIAAAQARIGRICDGPSMVREANRLAAQHRLRLPLCAGVEKLLNGEASPSVVLAKLLTSDNHAE